MKKALAVIFLATVITCGVFAQKEFTETTKSYVNVPVVKVYENNDAYVVVYRKSGVALGTVSIPMSWFKQNSPEKKAIVRPLDGKLTPYMTLCFDNNEMFMLYISMPVSKQDAAWGVYPKGKALPPDINPNEVAAGR